MIQPNNDEYKTWLDSLKVGDEVVVDEYQYGSHTYTITKIKTITPKRWIKTEKYPDEAFKEGKWYHSSKYDYSSKTLLPVTDEIKSEIQYRHALSVVRNIVFEKLPKDKLMEVYKIFETVE